MTNELKKAIETVKAYLDMDSDVDSEYLNAQRTIIKALEAQPTSDDEIIKALKAVRTIHNGNYAPQIDEAIRRLEAQPTDAKQDCEHCIHTYGTLGCCDMVNNEWVYDCDFGKEQYKKEHEEQPTDADCISRQAVLEGLANIAKAKAKSDAQKSMMGRCMFFIEQLPSVTPERPKGGVDRGFGT